MTDLDRLTAAHEQTLRDVEAAMARAADIMDLRDVDDEDLETAWEERYHCGVCVVRTVMQEVWPEVEAYFDLLRKETHAVIDGPPCCKCCG